MDKKELKQKIDTLEGQWQYHHKHAHKSKEMREKYPMPDMIELVKLRCELERLERED